MERDLWPRLWKWLKQVSRSVHQKDVTYQPWVIVAVVLWAALHDRPVSWACEPRHWSTTKLRPSCLPSPSTLSRRMATVSTALAWRALEDLVRREGVPGVLSELDGKPLTVGGYSKDREAKVGYATGGFARGYRLHALWSGRLLPEAWEVTPLNVKESTVGRSLVRQAARGGYILADSQYDAGELFERAAEGGYQLLVPAKRPGIGRGHRPVSPHRRRSIELMQGPFGEELYRHRDAIERRFGNAVSFGGGLTALPPWVRRGHRVRAWVWAKLLINAARLQRLKALAT